MKTQVSIATLIASIATMSVHADDKAHFNAQFAAGALSDSQLFIDELQHSNDDGDNAMLYKADAKFTLTPSNPLKIVVGTGLSDKRYQQQRHFDLRLFQANIDASYQFNWLTVGASHHHIDAKLDKEDFMTLSQTSLYASKLFQSRYYLRATVTKQDKSFASGLTADDTSANGDSLLPGEEQTNENPVQRDAINRSFGGDLFVFFNQAKTFINVGFAQEKENAQSDYLDYQGNSLHATFGHSFYGFGKKQQIQLGWQHQQRKYQASEPGSDLVRSDDRNSSRFSYQFHFTENWSIKASHEMFDYQSNEESAVYDGNKSTLMLKVDF